NAAPASFALPRPRLLPAPMHAGYATNAAASTTASGSWRRRGRAAPSRARSAPTISEEPRLRIPAVENSLDALAKPRLSVVGPRQDVESVIFEAVDRMLGNLGR